MAKELRKEPRVPVHEMVLQLPGGIRPAAGNISVGGVGFATDTVLGMGVGDRFSVSLRVPDSHERLQMHAQLCHLRYDEGDGLFYGGGRFIDVDELVEYPLFRYVEETALELTASAMAT